MKQTISFKATSALWLVLMLLTASGVLAKDKEPVVLTLHGEVMDSQCAYNVHSLAHSHDSMINKGVAGAHDAKSCTSHCVKEKGGVYVLLVKNDVYRLDDQDQSELFAGQKVKVSGTLDQKTHTLHIFKMEEEQPK